MAGSSIRKFLEFLRIEPTATALSELITKTRLQHRNDNFETDDALLRFASLPPLPLHSTYGSYVKGIFRANRTPLNASFNTHYWHSTKKISPGILKAIYESLDEEHRAVMDYQAYAGERVSCICRKATIQDFEDYDEKYTIIRIKAPITKARNDHICIIPRQLADWIRDHSAIRAQRDFPNTSAPFPNHETLWKDITGLAHSKFGTPITSHYLRKRFHTIAGKTPMPVNSWDYLMGDKQSWGHEANTYTLEDFSELVREYDRYLAPYLSIVNPKEPGDPKEPIIDSHIINEQLHKENVELKEQILILAKLLTQKPERA